VKLASFYPILDTGSLAQAGLDLVPAAATLLEAGAKLLQLRHKGHFSRELFQQAEAIADLCKTAGALFVINDRADMAALLGTRRY
jgi:thiamine-phosphate pyrophosphorylase